ncbi:hypothetical protein BGW36DRAFT_374661 [Talaromyces proteolyticus]|uniref:WD repeat-containing protein n=1 Tax=Talaromyces proteolyticus TaxID=1131652 RepID=A0AAD4KTN1_9EURO|nr:uncharacterized protein BGW36DRAFT_374661 [Talaromyces proteolyticus]KAH8700662.1 hypothetical protein BGW36DRAFT_374661 [Talaromyces proteolyticus]
MPHSNDRTLITCAGDSEVRIFDVEYSLQNQNGTSAATNGAASLRTRRLTDFFTGVRYLTTHNTNTRVYRSHADRVKRIVTESSPYLFLTCSEDGEVRQWDLRQPSSAYPAPQGGQGFMAYRPGIHHNDTNVPPPLISYKRYHLDLNTISCSASQPHYIALGGAHLHCFLHDRRMVGRDLLAEKGQSGDFSPIENSHGDEAMSSATRCVRRFAPRGQRKMKAQDNGHITACKISDARPNEIVVSWSGDHIYSFDLVRSPDARETETKDATYIRSRTRKRKRGNIPSSTSLNSPNRHQSRRRSEDLGVDDPEVSIHIRYGNGDSENIPISMGNESFSNAPEEAIERARTSVLNEAQKLSHEIAKGLVKLRKALFSIEGSIRETTQSERHYDIASYEPSFTSALGHACDCLVPMDKIQRSWRYPMNPTTDDVILQQTLRRNRESTRRFVQASGTLATFLGGQIEGYGDEPENVQTDLFSTIVPAPSEDGMIDTESQFGYDFLKAVLLWLGGGRDALVEGFKLGNNSPRNRKRFPIPEHGDDRSIEDHLIPYLQDLAGSSPIVDVDASRFEHDEARILFLTQQDAVTAFEKAVQLSLEDLDGAAAWDEENEFSERVVRALNGNAAKKFWGLRVGRGLLMSVGEGINFEFVNRAFGGLRAVVEEDDDEDDQRERMQEDIDPEEDEDVVEEVRLVSNRRRANLDGSETANAMFFDGHSNISLHGIEDIEMDGNNSSESDNDDDDHDSEENDDDDEEGEEDEYFFRRGSFPTSRFREGVNINVPCGTHENIYRGHCNIKTVKDINYYGMDDEYVVSGSDSGHVFIWDRKTAKLVNILEGDSEVVNVVQGHPYEPTLAVSGIDNTIKIFSPDRRLQSDARYGINILNPDNPANMFGSRPRNSAGGSQVFGLRSCKRLKDSYQIMSQNDVDRQGGMSDAYITRSMLTRLAQSLRQRHTTGGTNPPVDTGEGTTIVLDENCTIM